MTLLVRKHDRIVFLGDSITEQQLYSNYVETYLATRFPEFALTFFNAGWGGDTAPGGLARLDRDVLRLKPDVVTICYGMNDGRYQPSTPEIVETFSTGLSGLVKRLKKAGVRVVLLTPGIVDEAKGAHLAACHYNRCLRPIADAVVRLAKKERLPVADLHRLMSEVDARAKSADAAFCMIPDGVHPDPAGHLVMAHGLLTALGVPPRREIIRIPAGKPSVAGDRSITVPLARLPFFVEPLARKVLPFLPFQQTFNAITLTVRGITADMEIAGDAGRRSLPIPAADFGTGIDLASLCFSAPTRLAADALRYTVDKDRMFCNAWRTLSLKGANGPYYHAKAHAVGIAFSERLDRCRPVASASDLAWTLTLSPVSAELRTVDNGAFITHWQVMGTLPKPYTTDALGGEAQFTAAERPLGPGWFACTVAADGLPDCLNRCFGPSQDCFAYALAILDSPDEQTASILLGSDDGYALWLNGEVLASRLDLARGCIADSDRIAVRLKRGRNVLLMKISQGGGQWGFCLRFCDLVHALHLVPATMIPSAPIKTLKAAP